MKHFAILFVGLLLSTTADAGDVYVTTDATGQKIYTDTPRTVPARKLDIRSQSTDQDTAETANPPATERDGRQQPPSAGARVQQAPQAAADDRAVKCIEARQRYETLMNSLTVFTLGPNGEPNYLTVEQMSEARVQAKQFLDKFCADQ